MDGIATYEEAMIGELGVEEVSRLREGVLSTDYGVVVIGT